jgi:hypothetical protein
MEIKKFDAAIIDKYRREMRAIGKLGEKVGDELLNKEEGFEPTIPHPKRFPGQPFDRLCRRRGKWYIVETKTGSKDFGGGRSVTQKKRMTDILKSVKYLSPVLLQINPKHCLLQD